MILDWRRVSHIIAALVLLTTPALADPFSAITCSLSSQTYSLPRSLSVRAICFNVFSHHARSQPKRHTLICRSLHRAKVKPIPRIYGRAAVGAKVIWLGPVRAASGTRRGPGQEPGTYDTRMELSRWGCLFARTAMIQYLAFRGCMAMAMCSMSATRRH